MFSKIEACLMNCFSPLLWQVGCFRTKQASSSTPVLVSIVWSAAALFWGEFVLHHLTLENIKKCKTWWRIYPCSLNLYLNNIMCPNVSVCNHFISFMWHISEWNRIFDEKMYLILSIGNWLDSEKWVLFQKRPTTFFVTFNG